MRYAFDRRPAETGRCSRFALQIRLVLHPVRLLRSMSESEAGQARVMQARNDRFSQIGAALKDSGNLCGGIVCCRVAPHRGAGGRLAP